MNSPNGKIPAGTATSVISGDDHRVPGERTLPLEKCPDKAAQVVFLQSVEFVRKRPNNYTTSSVGLRTNLKYSSVTSLTPKGTSLRDRSPAIRNDRNQ